MTSPIKVHYFQHIAEEGLGSCEYYLKHMGAQISTTEFFALPPEQKLDIEALPSVEEIDLLIIMDANLSVNDEAIYPWLIIEKRWIRRFIALGKPVIGLCFGGQMIANALGAKVSPCLHKEIGWTEVFAVEDYPERCFICPERIEVMQWHVESFALPKGAKLLASNAACAHQAFQIGDNILAFQFHPEVTPAALKVLLDNDEVLLHFAELEQQVKAHLQQAIRITELHRFQAGNELLNRAIDYVLSHTAWREIPAESNYISGTSS